VSQVNITIGRLRFTARFEEAAAPPICAAFRTLLHSKSNCAGALERGSCVGTTWRPRAGSAIGERYESSLAGRFSLLSWERERDRVAVAHVIARVSRAKFGQLAGNHFLTITSGLEGPRRAWPTRIVKGSQTILIELT